MLVFRPLWVIQSDSLEIIIGTESLELIGECSNFDSRCLGKMDRNKKRSFLDLSGSSSQSIRLDDPDREKYVD